MPDIPFDRLSSLVCDLKTRKGPGYDAARERVTWNKRLDMARAPDAVVAVRSAEQVAAAIRFAAAQGLKVSPRGSGHHYEAAALHDGGLLLDVGGLDSIEIDAAARTARVGAGVRGGVLAEKLAAHGLGFPVGHCIDVGLSGYLLSGGFGWNGGEWGAASANVAAIEMVTADGEIVLADATNHADLFWAARGHGPGLFAAVIAYHLNLQELPANFYAWRLAIAAEHAPALADWLSTATDAAHPAAEIGCFLLDHWDDGEPSVILRVSVGGESENEARERIASFLEPPASLELRSEPNGEFLPFTDLFKMSPMPSGKRVAADHLWSDAALGDLLMAAHGIRSPSPHSTVDLVAYGGHTPVALGNGALSVTGRVGAGIYALWDDPSQDETNRTWVRRIDEALAPLRTGRYVAECDLTLSPNRRPECFTPEALARLAELRARHDPTGLFHTFP